jgi:hypothetical protein
MGRAHSGSLISCASSASAFEWKGGFAARLLQRRRDENVLIDSFSPDLKFK